MTAVIWSELMSRDVESSERFYQEVLGLSVVEPGQDGYRLLMADGVPIGGLTGPRPDSDVWPSGGPSGHWVAYFESSDIAAAAARAEELGGSVLLGPLDIPGTGTVAVVRDHDGAVFGLFKPSANGS